MSILTPSQVKQIYNDGKPTIPQPVHWWKMDDEFHASVEEYASGTDGDLNSPNDSVTGATGFNPMCSGGGVTELYIGTHHWRQPGDTELGPNELWLGQAEGISYGTVRIAIDSGTWDWFAAVSGEDGGTGLQSIVFTTGGRVSFYYIRDAWMNAFAGNALDALITLDGSVYKGSVLPENLVVSGAGVVGYAGKGHGLLHTTGTSGNLASPDSNNITQASFVPCQGATFGRTALYLGTDYIWTAQQQVGNDYAWPGNGTGSTYGTIKFNSTLGGYDWDVFADSSNNGLKTLTFNGSEGSFTYYYHRDAWYNAFNGNSSDIIISLDGSVYKGSVSYANLVVTGEGIIGPASGGGIAIPEFNASEIEYATGTDGNLTNPVSTGLNQNDCFTPMYTSIAPGPFGYVYIGQMGWGFDTAVGTSTTIHFSGLTGSYGSVKLKADGETWDTFAGEEYNGVQRFYFPRTASNDKLGGYIDYYYHRTAWMNAFNSNSTDAIITLDGSVYKGSVAPAHLVVSGTGVVGPAGAVYSYTPVVDSGSLFINGVSLSTLTSQVGYKGKCYQFDGTTSYINTNVGLPAGIDELTVGCWVKIEGAADQDSQYIINHWGGGVEDDCFLLAFLYGTTRFEVKFKNSNATEYALQEASGASSLNTWYHIMMTYKRNNYARFYKNGIEALSAVATADYALRNSADGHKIHMSAHHANTSVYHINGKSQDVRMYYKALTTAQIKDIYNNTEKHYS